MGLRITDEQIEAIRQHAAREYPNECCGALLGVGRDEAKEVRGVQPLRNLRKGAARAGELLPLEAPERESERNRFLIDPDDLRRAERDALGRGIEIVGFYHSHPDHPARPSEYDRDHAFPWYSYVIIAVEAGKPGRYTSWVLRDDRTQFDEECLEVEGQRAPATAKGDQ
ncbi:MAG: Mov34/MPN/PAD-1 family protein [Terriglobia bacterium]